MSESKRASRPEFRGLSWHQETDYSFLRPIDWLRFEWLDGRQGVLFGPDPDDNATLFAVDVQQIGIEVSRDDIPDLEAGFLDGINGLEASNLESHEHWIAGVVIGLEAKYTFHEGGTIRKRWVRTLYQDSRQITVTAQGATVDEYDYWLPMFYEQMMTFKIHSGQSVPDASQR